MRKFVSCSLGVLLVLSGCHRQPAGPAAVTVSSPGIVVSQAQLVLPAVKGHPGAAYFTLGNESGAATTLTGVDIAGAKQTEIHQTAGGTMAKLAQIRIDPGQRVIFAPSGKHVMAFGLADTLAAGSSATILFHFQDGRTTAAALRVEAAGGAMGAMPGMDMGGKN